MTRSNLNQFKGIHVAISSCYDTEGNISTAAVRRLIRFLIERKVNGVYVGGSTGEGLLQTVDERKQVLEAVIQESRGEITVMAHIGAINTRDSVELAVHAERVGADAVSAVPPFYYRYSEKAVRKHWQAILMSSDLPFIIYHIPSTTGFSLTSGLLREMIEDPKVIGVKISSGSTYELERFKAVGGDDFLLFNGPDEQYLAGRIMGADAGIGGTYGVMPELFVRMEQLYAAGRLNEAQKLQTAINDIISGLLGLPIHSALKELLRLRGVDCGSVRAPMEEITESQQPMVALLHEKIRGAIDTFIPNS
ncbi:dihydrodipicolinate synthase family protein [Paenibacillus cremeus]|uniref:N-acetylneuraminate lyase n=1 Tax=Paenibacillus cremeus TaxID=2163881 RepID=A0A559K7C3_9BACL|nr:dihydrodipicolinate synthase family protein [Paenibacillus cremeus]TVY08032.1 N-acetylneuraminate lyase [Paenibacillus cremeus]